MYCPDITWAGLAWHKSSESSQNGGCVVVALAPDGGIIVGDDKEKGDNPPVLHFIAERWHAGAVLNFSLVESVSTVPDRLRELFPDTSWYYATDETDSHSILYFTWEELQKFWTGLREGEFTIEALGSVTA